MPIIFGGKPGAPVEMRAWLGNEAVGWFTLEKMAPNGDYQLVARSTKAPDADDDIVHQFSSAELAQNNWGSLRLRLKVNAMMQAGGTAPLFLRLTQNGVALPAMDGMGDPISKKDKDERVKLADVASNKPELHDFSVWFS